MIEKTGFNKYIWVIMLVLSLLLLAWAIPLLLLSNGEDVLVSGLRLAGSTLEVGDIDNAALGFLNMAMLKPVWEECWIGILGIYCAVALKQKKDHARMLSLFWGIMLITNAVIQGWYEVIILDWSNACPQTCLFLLLGTIAVASQLITGKSFSFYQSRSQK